ncbi:hypothetical protein DFJ63DRAFT_315089 [Scheffersomyces coipomensis]|uniref:uncharacterized protein n=1 Tax=Scheffersomyces coipomensis TaxID=1788519 RepID=UPI00315D7B65
MGSLTELFDCSEFIAFYKRNEQNKINLFTVFDDPEIKRRYDKGLKVIEELPEDEVAMVISNLGIERNLSMRALPSNKASLIMLFRLLNSHIISRDIDYDDPSTVNNYVTVSALIAHKNFKLSFEEIDVEPVEFFKRYTVVFKLCQLPWNMSCNVSATLKIDVNSTLLSETTNTNIGFNSRKFFYNEKKNIFFRDYGFFYPMANTEDVHNSIDQSIFDVQPNKIPSIVDFTYPFISNKDKLQSEVEFELRCVLQIAKLVFVNFKDIKFVKETNTLEVLNISTQSTPDIIMSFNNNNNQKITIPIEIKRDKMMKKFIDFVKSRDKSISGSKSFVQYYSQAFHQSFTLRSNCFVMTDGLNAIGIVSDHQALDTDNVSNLRGIKCKIYYHDCVNSKLSLPLFILNFALTFATNTSPEIIKAFEKTLIISEDQKSHLIRKQYTLLDGLRDILIKVPNINESFRSSEFMTLTRSNTNVFNNFASDKNSTSSADSSTDQGASSAPSMVHDISSEDIQLYLSGLNTYENDIFNLVGVKLPLDNFSRLISGFEIFDLSSIKIKSIISGKLIGHDYSVVFEDEDGDIIKVFDPVRCRVESTNKYTPFKDRIKRSYDLFIRETMAYEFLSPKFNAMATLKQVGFISNNLNKYIEVGDKLSVGGFFIKLSKIKGVTLDCIDIDEEVEEKLWELMKNLHGLHFSHGDIHENNFMIEELSGEIKIIDFGMSDQGYYRGNNDSTFPDTVPRFDKRVMWDKENLEKMIAISKKRMSKNRKLS